MGKRWMAFPRARSPISLNLTKACTNPKIVGVSKADVRRWTDRYVTDTWWQLSGGRLKVVKKKRAWISSNALEVTLLGVGSAFVIVAAVIASFAGIG